MAWVPEHPTEVIEVLLCGGALLEFGLAPLVDEFLGWESWLTHSLSAVQFVARRWSVAPLSFHR
jgi:hypothetical protein